MYIKGVRIDQGIKYVKFHKSTESKVEVNPELKSMDIYGLTSGGIKEYMIDDMPEYIKLGNPVTLSYPNFSITKHIYEDVEVNILIAKINEEISQDIENKYYFYYDRLTILLRSDKHTLKDLEELLDEIPGLEFSYHGDPDSMIGNSFTQVIRSKDQESDYYQLEGVEFSEDVSVLDWSHAVEGLNSLVYDQVKHLEFAEPITKTAQEIPEAKNLIRYDFNELQQSGRGHLVGNHWKYFYMTKMPIEYEFICTETSTYVKLLNLIQEFNLISNIGDYWVTANDGLRMKCAMEWTLPVDNGFELNDPKGSSDTTGNVIRINGFIHFNTITYNKIMHKIEEILNNINNENDNIIQSN